jgi:nitrogen fixation/metabolism regulation signal transduction histidine kinase
MAFSRFHVGIVLRTGTLILTIGATSWMITHTSWYVAIALAFAAALAEMTSLVQFCALSSREIARFLDALAANDLSQSFTHLRSDVGFRELGAAMEQVLGKIRTSRTESDAQRRYLQTLIDHVPVALVSIEKSGALCLLNKSARRLFERAIIDFKQLSIYGEPFSLGLDSLLPGKTSILRMEKPSGALLLKAAATEIVAGTGPARLISLQNIGNEMSAQELAAWQNVIRVMAHEVMNSLTPVSSLTDTACKLVGEVLEQLSPKDPHTRSLAVAHEALETASRRSESLLQFVRSHRRLIKPLEAQIQIVRVQRHFARIQRLLAHDLADRAIQMSVSVDPESLELGVDADLLDQALINLMRNAIEALRDRTAGSISLTARRDSDGRVVVAVSDNGPGISLDLREKVFVPFFTTKRQGSGIGLTLVRQIAAAHGALVEISETPDGGATVVLRLG